MRVPARLAAVLILACPGLSLLSSNGLTASMNPPAPARAAVPMASHRALYKLTLDSTHGSRQITGATGTMGYEVADVCDGWATRQRLQIAMSNIEGQDEARDSDYATWEARDGLSFRFHMVEKRDQALIGQTDGSASLTRTGGPGEAIYRIPAQPKIVLPAGTLFPMMHTIAAINAAREGKKFLALPLFDGTEERGIEDSTVVILDWKPPFETKYPMLNSLASTRMRIAFFDHGSNEPMPVPTYETSMRYWENGVADDMLMDFGDFVMHAVLTELTPLPRRC